jgi:Holliday junction resolvase RusA-like endonuclease
MTEIIYGTVPSKSNCYRVTAWAGRGKMYKAEGLKQYEESFEKQCSVYKNRNIDKEFEFQMDVYYPNRRSDLDNSAKVVLDCLQKVNAISNDNKCVKIILTKHLDKDTPRIEFRILEI